VDDHVRSEIVVPESEKVLENGKGFLASMESVKLQNGRADLRAILRDEVEMATGRMSVSGQSLFLPSTDLIILILLSVCGSQTIVRSVRSALLFPVCSPLNVANGGPSITLHVESFGYA